MKKKIIKLNVLMAFIIIILTSCNSYKFVFFPSNEETISKVSKTTEYVIKKEELFLCFTKTYVNTKVKIMENDSVVFDGVMTTKRNGRAETFKINIYSKTIIYFEGITKPLEIDYEKKKLYKYVYLEKQNKKVVIEFNNGYKEIGPMPSNQ